MQNRPWVKDALEYKADIETLESNIHEIDCIIQTIEISDGDTRKEKLKDLSQFICDLDFLNSGYATDHVAKRVVEWACYEYSRLFKIAHQLEEKTNSENFYNAIDIDKYLVNQKGGCTEAQYRFKWLTLVRDACDPHKINDWVYQLNLDENSLITKSLVNECFYHILIKKLGRPEYVAHSFPDGMDKETCDSILKKFFCQNMNVYHDEEENINIKINIEEFQNLFIISKNGHVKTFNELIRYINNELSIDEDLIDFFVRRYQYSKNANLDKISFDTFYYKVKPALYLEELKKEADLILKDILPEDLTSILTEYAGCQPSSGKQKCLVVEEIKSAKDNKTEGECHEGAQSTFALRHPYLTRVIAGISAIFGWIKYCFSCCRNTDNKQTQNIKTPLLSAGNSSSSYQTHMSGLLDKEAHQEAPCASDNDEERTVYTLYPNLKYGNLEEDILSLENQMKL